MSLLHQCINSMFFCGFSQNALVLLDLIGAKDPRFYNSFPQTRDLFERLQLIGRGKIFNRFVYQFPILSTRDRRAGGGHVLPNIFRIIKS